MTGIDETRFNSLENRVTKIEEHIKSSEKIKDAQWKTNVNEKLEDIKTEIKKQGEKSKKIADGTIAASAGLVVMVFSAQFLPFEPNIWIAMILLALGLWAISQAVKTWKRL